MGKVPKSSRKGKKAWRANISTKDVDEFYEKSTKDALTGGSVENIPSESLFFVDKSRDLSVKRKIDKKRRKPIRCDSVLHKNLFVHLVPSSHVKKYKKKVKGVKVDGTGQDNHKPEDDPDEDGSVFNLWGNQGEDRNITKRVCKPSSSIPAVEVEPPGCSYNPSKESHQDSLAHAVAEEMQKAYQNELRPTPVPLTVERGLTTEEEFYQSYFNDVDGWSDGDADMGNVDENGTVCQEKGQPSVTKRITKVERNKRARRKEQLKAEAEAKKVEKLSKEIDSLPEILQEIAKEDKEKQKRHFRKVVAKQERLKVAPPRLGKHKFQPAPSQVLLTEEISGSLRKLKGCSTLARDRYKSFEKRGLLVPTAKSRRK